MKNFINEVGKYISKHKVLYYILNFTWGLPLTIVGYFLMLVLSPWAKIKKYGYIYYIEIQSNASWGLSMGTTFITGLRGSSSYGLKEHEFGHTVQNAIFGPFMIFIVSIPSFIRCNYRSFIRTINPNLVKGAYYDIWFESTASTIGEWYESIRYIMADVKTTKEAMNRFK